ncbi:transposase [Patescibacteria group bacterium]|nr:transposase [Patescibacteria group bacterium]MBU4579602.1 transposase [Patescibacteria group bacterium]
MRKFKFTNGEHYHIFNRGNNKRTIFLDEQDFSRFFQSMTEFNSTEPIGSIFENSFRKDKLGKLGGSTSKLVDFICYCLNPNHFHFILKQLEEDGIRKFMHRIATGYTRYFDEKHNCSGSLFQGRYKAVHIDSNEYLLHLSAYINLNDRVHLLGGSTSKSSRSSLDEYILGRTGFCEKNIILSQFKSMVEYKKFVQDSLRVIRERKDMEKLLLE